jgi:Domain of unknown function (DUF383)/Domain of unknown function (DUF384)
MSSSSSSNNNNGSSVDDDAAALYADWKRFLGYKGNNKSMASTTAGGVAAVGSEQRSSSRMEEAEAEADRPDVRLAAVEAVLQQMHHPGSIRNMIRHGLVPVLAKNVSYAADDRVSLRTLQALLHLSSSSDSLSNGDDGDEGGGSSRADTRQVDNGAVATDSSSTDGDAAAGGAASSALCSRIVDELIECHAMNRLLEIALSPREDDKGSKNEGSSSGSNNCSRYQTWNHRVNLSLAIMANLTRTEVGAIELVGKTLPDHAVVASSTRAPSSSSSIGDERMLLPVRPTLDLLLGRFLNPAYRTDSNNNGSDMDRHNAAALDENDNPVDGDLTAAIDDPYQHFAAILMNITQIEAGRRFLLKIHRSQTTESSVLQRILPILKEDANTFKNRNPIRRRGIAGTVRNCCLLERDSAWWLLHTVHVTKYLLYPLAGPEELDIDERQGLDPDLWLSGPDKHRESDQLCRLWLVQAILALLSTGRRSREFLRLQRAYVVLKYADMVEERVDVSECIAECVNYLRRDEHGTDVGSSDRLVRDAYRTPSSASSPPLKTGAASAASVGGAAVSHSANLDDLD